MISRPWRSALEQLSGGGGSTGQLILSVPGTLGIRSSAAPLVVLFAGATATVFAAVVKTAPVGADLVCVVNVDGTAVATLTISDGTTSTALTVSTAIAAGNGTGVDPGLVTLDITAVGSTFPGADLSVLVGF
jgi:hypothetical protein